MKGASKVIMGATVVMVVSLAIVLGLILVLLAELYCSLLLRRRKMMRRRQSASNAALTTTVSAVVAATNSSSPQASPLSSFYSQGVLHAPRNLLFPLVYCKEANFETGIVSSPSPVTSLVSSPIPVPETSIKTDTSSGNEKVSGNDLLYISNPVYDNDEGRGAHTPFETPETSPSRLEGGGSSDEEDDDGIASLSSPVTPPLTPMKKLPAQACSVSLGDARSVATPSNDSNSNNGASSSSSGSLRTSPSW